MDYSIDIHNLEEVISYISNNLPCSDEMQRLVSQIELRIAELDELNDL
ncbi:hypothetical protein AVV28_gp49 [Achromobacter phage JWX]|uniref:Uncharacterized protein n=1 Tax=Achromobacter phage JWX TaxID=1589746 RepID=A0A0B5A1S7_9CAUD|nr:hypothetical protein AVV28_gp06 [Achromobacter phage JWX]YP_009196252.1 hypothetical protein AVV28_gp49 [Achromobacter phage JWX]AJD82772.1 hypothetical protein JWX_00006 [Achromobacter phage JWX]AJD82833.1 hypothetical protein JWX_00068 [Achromobacter phage JWX]WLW38427.1 hypothetical protein JWT_00003 [Achromobacter phage JWT]